MQQGFKYIIHETLECGGCITKAKRHHQELILAFLSMIFFGGNISLFRIDLVIT
jgi:hypothetical protein